MNMSKNPVVHFEMPYTDAERVATFYKNAFGWNMVPLGENMGGYITAETTNTENGRPTEPGHINGGFYTKQADHTLQYPSVVIAVDDVQAVIQAVVAAGGQIIGEPMDIPGVGLYVSFTDSEGNRASLLKPV
jgi:predicted enzyme related to lactoylglutathione lyase